MAEIPTLAELRAAYESGLDFSLESLCAKPLLVKYQDAGIRTVLERIAKGQNRALLLLVTGAVRPLWPLAKFHTPSVETV